MKDELNQKKCCIKPNGTQIQAERIKTMLATYYQTCGVHLRTTENSATQSKSKQRQKNKQIPLVLFVFEKERLTVFNEKPPDGEGGNSELVSDTRVKRQLLSFFLSNWPYF